MRYIDLISGINNLADKHKVAEYFIAIRQDEMIWNGLQALDDTANLAASLIRQKKELNPGTLSILVSYPDFEFDSLKTKPPIREKLEELMFGFENYVQSAEPVNNLRSAVNLALALIEIRKTFTNWVEIFQDIVSRMKITDAENFRLYWGTIFVIVINLVDDQEELLKDLTLLHPVEIGIDIFDHLVLCIPRNDDEKADIFRKSLFPMSPQVQVQALKTLKKMAGSDFTATVASRFLDKYSHFEDRKRSTKEYWKNPTSSMQYAFQCQAASDIAHLAGEVDIAKELNNRSLEVFSALVKMSKVKKAGIVFGSDPSTGLNEIFTREELAEPEIRSALAYTNADFTQTETGFSDSAGVIQKAKRMTRAGNTELAREEFKENLKNLSDDDFADVLVEGPDEIPTWDPISLLNTLVESGAVNEAERLAKILLSKNPTNVAVNKAAAAAAEMKGKTTEALTFLETLTTLEPESKETKRKLANAYLKIGSLEDAYRTRQELLVLSDKPEEKDLVALGEIAILLEKPDEALRLAREILDRNPDSSQGFTLAGMAHHKKGDTEVAIDELRKATTLTDGEDKPWVQLAQLLWSEGQHASSLSSLKEGIAANPGNIELQRIYAQKLMDEGSTSEAFPYLLELSCKVEDASVDMLMVEAMKQLGMENIDETLEGLIKRYPEDHRFKGEYGTRLVWSGELENGKSLLVQLKEHLKEDLSWALAYVECMMQPDYKPLVNNHTVKTVEKMYCSDLLDDVILRNPENLRAKLLQAEMLLWKEDYNTSRDLFNKIMDESQGGQDLPTARLFSGLAQAAARTGDHDVAMAALEQAISQEPDWFGLQRIKADFYRLSGDQNEAEKQGLLAFEMAPKEAVNHIWLINFMAAAGQESKIPQLINIAITQFPDHLGLRLTQAQHMIGNAEGTETCEIEQKILTLIEKNENPDNLVGAAEVFAALDNKEKTFFCLEKAVSIGSLVAKLSLAGLHRILRGYEESLTTLNSIQPGDEFINLLKSEVEFDQTGITELTGFELNRDKPVDFPEINEKFLPAEWKEILDSTKPEIVLLNRVVMKSGEPEKLLDSVKEWINNEPDNLEARIYGVELSLASSAMDDYQKILDYEPTQSEGLLTSHFKMLRTENALDSNTFVHDDPLRTGLFETMDINKPEKIPFIRILAADGNLPEAETLFEMAMSIFSDQDSNLYVLRLGILRNLAKCAAGLNRWNEAFLMSQSAVEIAPRHYSNQILQLQNQALALEMKNRVDGLDVSQHVIQCVHSVESLHTIIDNSRVDDSRQEDYQHCILRIKLALEPTHENIRALALLSPTGEDAAALMAGLHRIGQFKTALQIAKKFTNHPQVMFESALCTAESDLPKAISDLEKSLLVNNVQPLALRLRSTLLEKAGRLNEAAEDLEKAIGFWPNEFRWHEKAAELWEKLGNVEKSVEHLKIAELFSSGNADIQEKLGKSLLSVARPEEGLKYLLAAVEEKPEKYELWQAIAEAHQQTGDLNLAMEAAERAVQVDPFAVKARLQAGKVRWTRGELDKALDQVNLAISLDPEEAENYVFMARLLLEQGDKAKALEMLDKVSESKNADVHTMVEHATLLKGIKGAAAARDLISAYSEKYPENPELLRLLAEAEDQCGNLRKAELVAKKALTIHPDESELQMLLGKIQEKVGNLDQAINYFSQAIVLEPKRKDGYLNLSQVYLKQRDHVKARKTLEQGIEKIPEEIDLYLVCASLLKDAKDYRGAEKMLRKASALDPRNVNIHRQLGAVLALNLVHQSQEVSSQP